MVWGTLSSKTLKSSLVSVVTRWSLSSSTVTFKTTSSTLRSRVYRPFSPRPITGPFSVSLGGVTSGLSGEATGSRSTLSGSCFSGCVGEADGCPGAPVACPPTGPGELHSRKTRRAESQLLQGRIVSCTSVNGQLGQTLWRNQLYLQFTPLPVP